MDVNATVAGLLRDLAFAQTSPQKMFGYKRAASAVFALEHQLTALSSHQAITTVRGIGPASARVIREVIETGGSPTVERAVEASPQEEDIARRRQLRAHVLSRAAVLDVLQDASLGGLQPDAYRGDLQMHSEWSDGVPTLHAIADACAARGYAYAAVTDHSYGLKIAGGMSMEEAAHQHEAIDRINRPRGCRSSPPPCSRSERCPRETAPVRRPANPAP